MNALVVDAKDEQRGVVRDVLERSGYAVVFHAGAVLQETLEQVRPDLVVVGGAAARVLPGLRAMTDGRRTSLLALGEVDEFERLLTAGADDVVTLPLDGVVLRGRAAAAAHARARRREVGDDGRGDAERLLEQLRAAEEVSRKIIDTVPGGVVHVGIDGRIRAANTEALELLGLSWDELTRAYTADFEPRTLHEDGSPCTNEDYPVTRALLTGEPQPPMTIGVERPDGTVSWAVFTAMPLHDGRSGAVTGAVVTFLDITSRREVEQVLRESEARYRAVVERSPDPILVVQDERIEFVNSAAVKLLGVTSPHVVLGRPVLDLVPSGRGDAMTAMLRRVLAGEGHGLEEAELRRPDGEVVQVEVAAVSFPFQGRPAVQLAARDITERKRNEERVQRLEKRIRQAQKLESLGVLAGGIAHDFNNLLSAVLGNASLARLDVPHGTESWECLERIEIAARRASDLTNQMLAYSGKGRFVIEATSLSTVVDNLARLLGDIVRPPGRLRLELSQELPPIDADVSQIQQVIMALTRNGAEALRDGEGTVTIRTGKAMLTREALHRTYLDEGLPAGEYVYVEVADDGCGMDEATAARVFDPFFSTKGTGRGLGLAAALGIVRGHHGTIQVRSDDGQGTAFRVYFPVAPEHARATALGRAAGDGHPGGATVLVVDDEDLVRDIARRILERNGFKVMTAPGGLSGLELYLQQGDGIDCVLLDITMPDMSGDEVLAEIRRRDPRACVVMTSGYAVQDLSARFGASEPTGFVQKPYSPSQLVETIRRALDKALAAA